MKKTLAALALAGSIALVGSAPAMAATYPALPPAAGVSDGTVGPGETFTFTAQGFLAGETDHHHHSYHHGHRKSPVAPQSQQDPGFPGTPDAERHRRCPGQDSPSRSPSAKPGHILLTATGNTSGVTVGPSHRHRGCFPGQHRIHHWRCSAGQHRQRPGQHRR
jgi:hypothetical protein